MLRGLPDRVCDEDEARAHLATAEPASEQPARSSPSTTHASVPLLLSVTAAARLQGVSRSNAYNLIKSGDLPYVRVGSVMRVARQALEAWVSQVTRVRQGPPREASAEPR